MTMMVVFSQLVAWITNWCVHVVKANMRWANLVFTSTVYAYQPLTLVSILVKCKAMNSILYLLFFFRKSHLFPNEHLCVYSFPLHPLSPLSLASCFGTSLSFHCVGISASLHLLCVDVSLFYAGLFMPRPRPPWPCSTCSIIYHVLLPILLAEPLLMGSFPTLLRDSLLLLVALCSVCNAKMFFCSCTSV